MKDLLDKLSSYNVFNYLLPGVLLAVFGSAASSLNLIVDDIIVGVFVYYFYGLVVSRIGSLILEPILRRIKVVEFVPYPNFVTASRVDPKLETLSEQNNVYRTIASTLLCLTGLVVADRLRARFPSVTTPGLYIGLLLLLALFIWSYRKQTQYISARVDAVLCDKSEESRISSRQEECK